MSSNWITVYASPSAGNVSMNNSQWKTALNSSLNQIIWRKCNGCSSEEHRNIFYRRITSWGNINIKNLFIDTWADEQNGTGNKLNVDFELYSTYSNAVNRVNRWNYCNYNDNGIGFPRDCGSSRFVGGQWRSWSSRVKSNDYWMYMIEQNAGAAVVDKDQAEIELLQSFLGNDPNEVEEFQNPPNIIENFSNSQETTAESLFRQLSNNYDVKLNLAKSQEELMSKQRTMLNEKENKIQMRNEKLVKETQAGIDTDRRSLAHYEIDQTYLVGLTKIVKIILFIMCVIVLLEILFPGGLNKLSSIKLPSKDNIFKS